MRYFTCVQTILASPFAILFVVLTCPTASQADEASAIAWVEQNKGKVIRDETHPDRPVVEVHTYNYLGGDGKKVTDAGLNQIAAFTKLKRLDLSGSHVTDAGMATLARCKNLEELNLSDTEVTDEGIEKLAPLKSLRVVELSSMPITDRSLESLARHHFRTSQG